MFSRTEKLIGAKALEKLQNSRVAVFGLGGVGGYVVEALVRAGVGALDLVDNDVISVSNINRQIIALQSTVGKRKTEIMAARVKEINPEIKTRVYDTFVLPENVATFDFTAYDYVVDAIDTVSGKIAIIESAKAASVSVISCMGTGNKLNASAFEIADIAKTSVCPLARVMRRELKKRGIEHVKVLYSKEEPIARELNENDCEKPVPASISFVPPVAGLFIAAEVIKDLIK